MTVDLEISRSLDGTIRPGPERDAIWVGRPRRRHRRPPRASRLIVNILTVAAGVGGALAGCHPTGTPVVDPLYTAVFAGLITVAASRASRSALLVFAAVGAVLSRSWLLLPGDAAVLMAFSTVFDRRSRQRVGALIGALSVQVMLRWPAVGFHGLTALIAGAAALVCCVSALSRVSRRARRWTIGATIGGAVILVGCSIPIAVGAVLAHPSINKGVSAAEGALATVSSGSTQASTKHLDVASTDFAAASRRVGAWWSDEALVVPVVAQQRRAVAGATAAGQEVTSTAAQVAGTIDFHDLSSSAGQLNLARISGLAAPIDRLEASLAQAQTHLAHVQSPWLVHPLTARLDTLGAKVVKAHSSAYTAAMAIRAAPGILGGDGVRHYFVAFMTPAEERGLDGFIGAYGELKVDNGQISLTRAGSVPGQLDQVADGKRHITGQPEYLARYGAFDPANHFLDLSYSPNFPTVENVIAQMYPQSGGDHIDGVLALDPYGLAALLNLTGPVTMPGLSTPLTSSNAAAFLLKGEYDQFGAATAARHDFLQDALSKTFARLVSGGLPAPETVAQDLDPQVKQGRVLFWTGDRADQPLLRRVGLAGSFPQVGGTDLLAVTTQNAANNKIDAYLHRSIDDEVRYDPATGQTQSEVTVTLHNATPASGLPNYVLGSYPGSGLARGTNQTWISIYTPLAYAGGTVDGSAVSMHPTLELGVNAFSTYIEIPAGHTVTLKLTLTGILQPGSYSLTVWNQPMANAAQLATVVSAPPGWHPGRTASVWTPAAREEQTERTRFHD